MHQWVELILLFFIYSFIGWLWETVYCSLKADRFVYRGFLAGPYCPIYGFGILGVLYFLEPFKNNLILLYFLSAILVSVLEYLTSYFLEKMFHASWWDYKDVPLNINGRVALPVSAFWGIACVVVVQSIHPRVMILANFLEERFRWGLPVVLLVILAADMIYTVTNMQQFRKITDELNEVLEKRAKELSAAMLERGEAFAAELNELRQSVEKELSVKITKHQTFFDELRKNTAIDQRLKRLNFSQRRWIKNYPKLKLNTLNNSETVKGLVRSVKNKKEKM
ncbi:hypothetical protein IW492_00580 [Enterococcus sp. BWB1-3]|uniref:putative ABC transporter permease n=1 Tax=unclassified Enterococcus TaxID=2608891 RepID=UPI0019244765|nr:MULTISPECIES: hypothetical protein [unclassified Enterococcus]MBL1227725.1 hypothetical protein [Enterococcus sp. BWB1-3]MCB5952088.1 hypothetical protein [Enterococcus sp. BWT-B8]